MTTKFRLAASVCAIATLLGGCAQWTHFNDTRSDFEGRRISTFIDAKQRAVTAVKAPSVLGDQLGYVVQICAEPSPDALSALAASQGLSITGTTDSGALSNALAESAGSIGLRTQSIQLMRDAMYRLCEAALSGYVNPLAYESMFRRYQNSMVGVLAIEQLTGAVRAPAIVLGGQASADNAEEATKLTVLLADQIKQLEVAKTEAKASDAAQIAAKKAHDDKVVAMKSKYPPPDDYLLKMTAPEKAELEKLAADLAKAEQVKATSSANVARWEKLVEFTQKQQTSILGGGATASADGRIGAATSVDPATAIAVATSVENIVKLVTAEGNETASLCNAFWGAVATNRASMYLNIGLGSKPVLNPLVASCSQFAPEPIKSQLQPLLSARPSQP